MENNGYIIFAIYYECLRGEEVWLSTQGIWDRKNKRQKQPPEVFYKRKTFLKISQYLQENTFFGVFFIKVAGL